MITCCQKKLAYHVGVETKVGKVRREEGDGEGHLGFLEGNRVVDFSFCDLNENEGKSEEEFTP